MKKTGIRILSAIMIAVMLLSVTACSELVGFGDGETETDSDTAQAAGNRQNTENYIYNATELMITQPYQIEAASDVTLVGVPVTDGEYNYFYFKLGETKNVPVYYEDAYLHDGRTVSTYQWTTASITEDTYTEAVENSVSNSTNASVKAELKTTASASVNAKYGGFSAQAGIQVTEALSMSLSQTHTVSDKTTFTKKISDKVQSSRSREVKIDKDSEAGYYRYVIYADFEVYAALVCNIADKTVRYTYVSVPKPDSFVDTFRFSQTQDFSASSDGAKLALTEEMLATITVDLFQKDLPNKTANYVYASVPYLKDDINRKITDSGYFGLNHVSTRDTLDLSELSQYMTDEYTFWFDIRVETKCEKNILGNWKDGGHEMYLYGQDNEATEKKVDREGAEKTYGLVCGMEWDTKHNNFYYSDWYVSGDTCKEIMYIQYDAYGDGEDTWYLRCVDIEIKVIKK